MFKVYKKNKETYEFKIGDTVTRKKYDNKYICRIYETRSNEKSEDGFEYFLGMCWALSQDLELYNEH
jgi:hypothetical protein